MDEQALLRSGTPLINQEEQTINLLTYEPIWFLTTKVAFRDSRGYIVGIVGLSRDITRQKQEEEELKQAKAAADAANRAKSEFLARMSHRNPYPDECHYWFDPSGVTDGIIAQTARLFDQDPCFRPFLAGHY